jgi:hypothetical protein
MRTTVRIDDDLLRDLKEEAHREGTSLAKLVNRTLRRGVVASEQSGKQARPPYRQKTYCMGEPKVNLDKALALAAAMEDEETIRKLAQGK